MKITQRRYRIFAKEILLGRSTDALNWEYVYLFILGLCVICAGILPISENWFRSSILLISVFLCGRCFNQTKTFIKITGSLKKSVVPRYFVCIWREALAQRIASLVLPYVLISVLVGLIRYGLSVEAIKAVSLVISAAALGAVLAINLWDGQVVWYDTLFATVLLALFSWAWMSLSEQQIENIYGPLMLLLASFLLLPILYWRINKVSSSQEVAVSSYQNIRDYLAKSLRFQRLNGAEMSPVLLFLVLSPAMAMLIIFYCPLNFDSRLGIKLLQAPMIIAATIGCLVTTQLHWRHLLLPKTAMHKRVGTTTLLATTLVLLTSGIAWGLLVFLANFLLKITFGLNLPFQKFWFPAELGFIFVELYVWLALSIWLAAYLIKPRGILRKPAEYLEIFYVPMIISGIMYPPFDRKSTWQERLVINAQEILTGDTTFTFFATCAILIVVFVHLANRAWAQRDLSEILDNQRS